MVAFSEVSAVESLGLASVLCLLLVGFLIYTQDKKLDCIKAELLAFKVWAAAHQENAVKIKESQDKMEQRLYDHCVSESKKKEN